MRLHIFLKLLILQIFVSQIAFASCDESIIAAVNARLASPEFEQSLEALKGKMGSNEGMLEIVSDLEAKLKFAYEESVHDVHMVEFDHYLKSTHELGQSLAQFGLVSSATGTALDDLLFRFRWGYTFFEDICAVITFEKFVDILYTARMIKTVRDGGDRKTAIQAGRVLESTLKQIDDALSELVSYLGSVEDMDTTKLRDGLVEVRRSALFDAIVEAQAIRDRPTAFEAAERFYYASKELFPRLEEIRKTDEGDRLYVEFVGRVQFLYRFAQIDVREEEK